MRKFILGSTRAGQDRKGLRSHFIALREDAVPVHNVEEITTPRGVSEYRLFAYADANQWFVEVYREEGTKIGIIAVPDDPTVKLTRKDRRRIRSFIHRVETSRHTSGDDA